MRAIQRIAVLVIGFAFISGVFLPSEGNAATLAGNLTQSTTGSANSNWEGGSIGAENFVLSQSSTVNGLGFIFWYTTNRPFSTAIGAVNWSFYDDSNPASGVFGTPSSLLASGSTSSLTVNNLGPAVQGPNNFNYIHVEFSIADLVLGAGDYWVGFNIDRGASGGQVFWASAATGDGLNAVFNGTQLVWQTPYATGGGLEDTVFLK